MRLSVRQGDKDLLCNQQTIARKYQFSSPVESLEGKFSRQCWVCNWEDKSCLYLTAHGKTAEQGWDAFSSVWGGTGAKLSLTTESQQNAPFTRMFFSKTQSDEGSGHCRMWGKGMSPLRRRDRLVGSWRRKLVRLVESARVNSFSHEERFWEFLRMQSLRSWHSETMSFLPQLRKES